MKSWPEDKTTTVQVEELLEPIAEAIRASEPDLPWYKSTTYTGYDIGDTEKACSPSPDWHFSNEGREYHKERGRDIFDIALMVAFQLGVEQGRRMTTKELEFWKRLVESQVK